MANRSTATPPSAGTPQPIVSTWEDRPFFSCPGGAGSWEQLRGWTEARRAGNLTVL